MNPAEIPAQTRHDPQLQPAHAPLLQGSLALPDGAFQQHGDARDAAAITLAGRRAFAAGTEVDGLREVWIQAQCVARDFGCTDFSARSITVLPGFVQRSNDMLEECVCLPRELGALVWQWTARSAIQVRTVWNVPPLPESGAHQGLRWNSQDRWLLIQPDARQSQSVLYCFDRTVTWQVQGQGASLHVQAAAELQPGETITLVIAAGPTERALEQLSGALNTLSTLAPAWLSVTNRIARERVSIHSPFAYLENEWPWALQRLDTLLVEAPAGLHTPLTGCRPADSGSALHFKTSDAVFAALATLCVGDQRTARQLIEFLATTQNSAGEIAGGGTLTGALEFADHDAARQFLLLVAQNFAWTGEVGSVRRVWVHVRRVVASSQFNNVEAEAAAAVLRELSQTAEAIGERDDAVAFKAQADQRAPLGSARPSSSWLNAWSTVEHTDPQIGGLPNLAFTTALLIAPVVYDLFGAVPDAARNRVELRPRIPRDWDFLELNNLRVGDFRLSLRYRREGSRHSFLLLPLEGALPLRVILEPAIYASGIGRVRVDGQEAALDIRQAGNRWICPLQVVVDHDRTIVIEATRPEDA